MITLIISWRIIVKLEPSCNCPSTESLVGLLTSLVDRRSSDHVVKDGGYYFVNLIISFLPLNNVLWADGALIP
jgi:hypothetical protein